MTAAARGVVETFVKNLGTELSQTKKPLSLPVCLKAIQSAEEATSPLSPESLGFSLGSGRIKKLATFVKKGGQDSDPSIRHQAQSVADMVTKLHIFKELSLKDRSDFLDAAPLSLRKLGLRIYDFGRKILNFFRGTSDESRTAGVDKAINTLDGILARNLQSPGPNALTIDDIVDSFTLELIPNPGDSSFSPAIIDSFSEDVRQMSVEELRDLATSIIGKRERIKAIVKTAIDSIPTAHPLPTNLP